MAVKPKHEGKTAKLPSGLTPLQEKFIDEYMLCFNVTEAYLRAGYSGNGSRATIVRNAHRLYKSATIQEELEKRLNEMRESQLSISIKLEKFFAQMIENEDIAPKDRLKSAELLGKMIAAFTDKSEVSGKDLNFSFNITPASKDTEEEEEDDE